MFMVKWASGEGANGAVLIVLGSMSLLITSTTNLKAHQAAGIKLINCDTAQFQKYRDLRVDT